MERVDNLKKIVDSIRDNHKIEQSQLKHLMSTPKQIAIAQLLAIINNLHLSNDQQRTTISILEQIIIILSPLTSFPEPAIFLTVFDKSSFKQFCNQDLNDHSVLGNKVFGLYPLIKQDRCSKLMDFDCIVIENRTGMIGNPNWFLTRLVFQNWIRSKQISLTKQVIQSSYILLSSQQLLQTCRQEKWNLLWSNCYLWLHKIYLSPFSLLLKPDHITWSNKTDDQYINAIDSTKDKIQEGNHEDMTIYYLLMFIIKFYILQAKQSTQLKMAITQFKAIPTQSYNEIWQYLLNVDIMGRLANSYKLQSCALLCNKMLQAGKVEVRQSKRMTEEMRYFLPHILDKLEVINYVKTNRLQFWNYSLDSQVNEIIANQYLQQLHLFDQNQQYNIIINLGKGFANTIFNSSKLITNKQSGQAIISLIQMYNQEVLLLLRKEGYNQLELQSDVKTFVSQWSSYYEIDQIGINQQTFGSCVKFLTFNFNMSPNFKNNVYFPHLNQNQFMKSLLKFTEYLLSCDKTSTTYKQTKQILMNNYFVKNISRVSEDQLNILWAKWAEFLMYDEQILMDLLSIESQADVQRKRASADKQNEDISEQSLEYSENQVIQQKNNPFQLKKEDKDIS